MKIALVGTAPSSRHLAPFHDGAWKIWGVGPGNLNPESMIPRCDVFFELHAYDLIAKEASYKPYIEALKGIDKVWLQEAVPDIPGAATYPIKEMVNRYGPYFFTSSFSYMIAMAIKELEACPDDEKVIGFFGIDCSATEEYGLQRPGAHFFFMKAREAGIRVVCPPESDLLQPPALYGYVERDEWWRKTEARRKEYAHRLGVLATQRRETEEEYMRIAGALDDLQWNLNTWAQRHNWSLPDGTS